MHFGETSVWSKTVKTSKHTIFFFSYCSSFWICKCNGNLSKASCAMESWKADKTKPIKFWKKEQTEFIRGKLNQGYQINSRTMPSPSDVMDSSSLYSSCETLDSHRSSEYEENGEVNGNDDDRSRRKVNWDTIDYLVAFPVEKRIQCM